MQNRQFVRPISLASKQQSRSATACCSRDVHVERVYRFGEFEIVPALWELRRRGTPVPLTRTPFSLLLYLLEHHQRVVSKQELLDAVWPDVVVSDTALSTALKVLRCALGDDGAQSRWIRTLRGRGYQFVGVLDATRPCVRTELSRDALPTGAAVIDLSTVPEASPAIEAIARALSGSLLDAQRRNAMLVVW